MRSISVRAGIAGVLTAMLFAVVSGCDDEEITTPQPMATLDELWPNDDGHEWFYDLTVHFWSDADADTLYARDDVPPFPPMSKLLERLAAPLPMPLDSTHLLHYRLRFDGMGTTDSGATGQNLMQEVIEPQPTKPVARAEHFLQQLVLARPGLRDQLQAAYPTVGLDMATSYRDRPTFLSGTVAYEKTSEYIGTYGHLDKLLSFKWLEANLSVGHEFTMQLVPSLDFDVFLHVRVLGHRTITVASGTYENAVEVFYAIDFGVSCLVDSGAVEHGCYRPLQFGTIAYAPNVGPIASHERSWFVEGGLFGLPRIQPSDLTVLHRDASFVPLRDR